MYEALWGFDNDVLYRLTSQPFGHSVMYKTCRTWYLYLYSSCTRVQVWSTCTWGLSTCTRTGGLGTCTFTCTWGLSTCWHIHTFIRQ